MSSPIRFGTSGWRAIIADEFTVANARRVVAAIARHVVLTAAANPRSSSGPSLVVGYDPRFLSETFAALAAEEAARHGIRCYLSPDAVPTPAVAFAIRQRKADGGINFTASASSSRCRTERPRFPR
jgi:phosphoglucomutase